MGYEVNPWMILPFVVLLGSIALAPLFFSGWWGRHYPKVSFGLAAVTLVYYLAILPKAAVQAVGHTAHEYVSFIILIGSLFVVSGGIHITVKGEATPWENVRFLLGGAVIANVLGTTGASMLLIRPWLRMNQYRVTAHHVVFFIFIVSNVGGCLTPIGDPPLFLGYLKGIPFWWVAKNCWPMWAMGVAILLVMFYVVDRRNYLRAPKAVRERMAEPPDQFRCEGLLNLVFLAMILAAVLFLQNPPFLREAVMLVAAAGSYFTTKRSVHAANEFNWHPFAEVAILFVGIFATMMPALDYLRRETGVLARSHPELFTAGNFYWASGVLSSVLDNAPTYLSFLRAMFGAFIDPDTVTAVQQLVQSKGAGLANAEEPARQAYEALLKYRADQLAAGRVGEEEIDMACLLGNVKFHNFLLAISVGTVFFGATTYIGNGPNFMVKSITEQQKVRTPTFLGYLFKYSVPFMLPMLAAVWWVFFRR